MDKVSYIAIPFPFYCTGNYRYNKGEARLAWYTLWQRINLIISIMGHKQVQFLIFVKNCNEENTWYL